MAKSRRTPGPWAVQRSRLGELEPYGPDGVHLLSSEVDDARPIEEREANAALIETAPELLEAAQDVFDAVRSLVHESFCKSGTCRLCRLKRAIEKATRKRKVEIT